mmetsp:Transcript_40281/g.96559  ORF Transcript_40281/g.96559 Transcript_40281/m.96559 type:complete len:393 (+) Transcript_40281:103-1281(+)
MSATPNEVTEAHRWAKQLVEKRLQRKAMSKTGDTQLREPSLDLSSIEVGDGDSRASNDAGLGPSLCTDSVGPPPLVDSCTAREETELLRSEVHQLTAEKRGSARALSAHRAVELELRSEIATARASRTGLQMAQRELGVCEERLEAAESSYSEMSLQLDVEMQACAIARASSTACLQEAQTLRAQAGRAEEHAAELARELGRAKAQAAQARVLYGVELRGPVSLHTLLYRKFFDRWRTHFSQYRATRGFYYRRRDPRIGELKTSHALEVQALHAALTKKDEELTKLRCRLSTERRKQGTRQGISAESGAEQGQALRTVAAASAAAGFARGLDQGCREGRMAAAECLLERHMCNASAVVLREHFQRWRVIRFVGRTQKRVEQLELRLASLGDQ